MDYFSEILVYGLIYFCRQYRISISLFNMIIEKVCAWDHYFVQRRNAIGMLGLSLRQKITVAL